MVDIDYIHANKLIDAEFNQIPVNNWVIIDSGSIGINYAIKENNLIKVKTIRVYSNSESVYTEKEYKNWRNEIKRLEGY